MSKNTTAIKKMLNSKDIIYPHKLFTGLNLSEDDFINLFNLFEIDRFETTQKFIHMRNIANSIIKKDGLLQGVHYRETDRPELMLIFKKDCPVGWNERHYKASHKDDEKTADGKGVIDSQEVEKLNIEKAEYCERYKDILEEVDSFDLSKSLRINNGKATPVISNSDTLYPVYIINEDILDYLLNSTNLGSSLEIALINNYLEELEQFKAILEAGILYPDFTVTDYTGALIIRSFHKDFTALKENNSMNIPEDFGKINVGINGNDSLSVLAIDYWASSDEYKISSTFNNDNRLLERTFIHKALLPEPYQKKLK